MKSWLVVLVMVAGACGDNSTAPLALYDIPSSGPIEWGKAPFPSDLFRDASGNVEIAALPSTTPVWETVRASLQTRTGFCATCAIHFPIKGAIDPATLDGNVVLIDDAGTRIPIDVEWDGTNSVIALRASRGHVLAGGATYTVGLTNAIKGTDGQALRASDGMTSARAKKITTPAIAALRAAGVSDPIVAATSFTTEDVSAYAEDLGARVKAFYAAHGAPSITVTRVWKVSDGTLTDLIGTPAQDLPGVDNPAAAATGGTYALRHATTAFVIKGTFNSVRVITGAGKELGTVTGDVAAGDEVPFLLTIPTGVDVTSLPVVVFGHGAGGILPQQLALADTAGKAHAAVLSLETYLHGERSTDAADLVHELRGDDGTLGPDGFYESAGITVLTHLFGFVDVPEDQKASPLYLEGNITQMAAELHSLLQLATTSNIAPIAAVDASLAGIHFDVDRIYYVGVSLGTVYGTLALAADSVVKAAVLDVPLGSAAETLVENQVFRTQFELFALAPLDIPNDEYEPERHLLLQPSMAFYEWTVSIGDPIAFARGLAARTDRDTLWQVAGLDEAAGTVSGEGLIAVTGVPAVGDFQYATVSAGTAPISHAGALLYSIADHGMAGSSKGSSAVEPPGLPPFVPRSGGKLMFENPVTAVHDQITHFFETKRVTGVAEIR